MYYLQTLFRIRGSGVNALFSCTPGFKFDLECADLLYFHLKVGIVILQANQLGIHFLHGGQRPVFCVDATLDPCYTMVSFSSNVTNILTCSGNAEIGFMTLVV